MTQHKIIKTQRNYWSLLFILHFLLFAIWRISLFSELSGLKNSFIYSESKSTINYELTDRMKELLNEFYLYFGITGLLIFGISLALMQHLKNAKPFFIGYSLVYFLGTLTYALYQYGESSINYNYDDIGWSFVFYLFYVPITYLIIKNVIIGIKVDDTSNYLNKNKSDYLEGEKLLNDLKESQIFSEDEYKAKHNEILIKKIRNEFYLSENYQKLLDLKAAGILTEIEFNTKVEAIINSNLKNQNMDI